MNKKWCDMLSLRLIFNIYSSSIGNLISKVLIKMLKVNYLVLSMLIVQLALSSCNEGIAFVAKNEIEIDGLLNENCWKGAESHELSDDLRVYMLQDDNHLIIGVECLSNKKYYLDLLIPVEEDAFLNIHASMQLGERLFKLDQKVKPEFVWGTTNGWHANYISDELLNSGRVINYEFLINKQLLHANIPQIKLKGTNFYNEMDNHEKWFDIKL